MIKLNFHLKNIKKKTFGLFFEKCTKVKCAINNTGAKKLTQIKRKLIFNVFKNLKQKNDFCFVFEKFFQWDEKIVLNERLVL